ncbi:hypothetical protein BSL78_20716 [Apostichopus japonicus]|uniref:Uncharacterized protein n=1 Tax=Stichopus japonicus TaxID=307972 RepID=A0A2G8K356_STIJA|nr:hypothetical protein BSL78_20716 [Apostichopus japonicus]
MFSCHVENITIKRQTGNRLIAIDGELDYLILAYEEDGDDIDEEKTWLLEEKLEKDQEDYCDVCESLWWNCDRLPERYTEEEIGLPGKLFLLQCLSCPVGVAIYRTIIFVYIGECWITLSKGLLSFVGVVFMFSLGVFVYLLYFIRVSFQCHFKLLLAYIKELECDAKRCKGVIMQVAADFSCYRRLCEVVTILMFPATVLAIVSNLTWII